MNRTLIKNLRGSLGKEVLVSGWVNTRRDQGKMVFLEIRDRSGLVQGVVTPVNENVMNTAKGVRPEFVITAIGVVNERPEKNKNAITENGDIELEMKQLMVISNSETPFDLGSEVNVDTYLDHQPFTLRNERSRNIFKVQETIISSFREALKKEDFTEFQAPALVGGDAEGGAAAFTVDYYYDKKAYLATSPQFYKQIMVGPFERVFTTPKIFRGEKHSTTRHLSEYSSLDFEMGFIKNHKDVMEMLEGVIRNIISNVKKNHSVFLEKQNSGDIMLPEKIPDLKLREAQKILNLPEDPDLEPEGERAICEWSKREHESDFVFITHYPVSKRPFYTYEDESDLGYTKSFDLLFRGLEITTGGQRIHDYETLVGRIKSRGLEPEKFSFYLESFKVGMPPHGGSATGLERITAKILGVANIKEATLFPRDLNRIDRLLSE